jgi:hypothetical protein
LALELSNPFLPQPTSTKEVTFRHFGNAKFTSYFLVLLIQVTPLHLRRNQTTETLLYSFTDKETALLVGYS